MKTGTKTIHVSISGDQSGYLQKALEKNETIAFSLSSESFVISEQCKSMEMKVYHGKTPFDDGATDLKLVVFESLNQEGVKTPIELITEERARQQEKEGWSLEHDDQHTDQSLAMAAALYASPDDRLKITIDRKHNGGVTAIIDPWPWPDHDNRDQHDRMRRLQIAGALIVAEMERLQRDGIKEGI